MDNELNNSFAEKNAEALTQGIIDDVRAEADKMTAEADSYKERVVAEAQEKARALLEQAAKDSENNVETLIGRGKNASELLTRKTLLAAKQQIVGKVFSDVRKKLLDMPKSEYLALIARLIDVYAEKGDKVILSKQAPITAEEVTALSASKKLGLVAFKTGDFDGGIVLSGEKFDKDLTFSALIDAEREAFESQAAAKLFG